MGEKNTEISARVAEMIELLGETPNSFAKALGYKRAQTIYDIMSGKSAPSYDFFNKVAIAEISATINIKWLLTGIGVKIENDSKVSIPESNSVPEGIVGQLLSSMNEKDNTVKEQAEEIGRLRERISQLEREKGKDASDARTSGVANVG